MSFRALLVITLIFLFACSEDNPGNPPVASFEFTDAIDRIRLESTSSDPDGGALQYKWSASDNTIGFGDSQKAETFFKIPEGATEKEITITLAVSDGKNSVVEARTLLMPAYSSTRAFGLGKTLSAEVSHNKSYAWYLDQAHTGTHSLVNCGPASVTMAIKWFDKDFSGKPEDARDTYHSEGGWWYTPDIVNYLNKYQVDNFTIPLNSLDDLKAEIDNGSIAILCLDMFLVSFQDNVDYHHGKFYLTNASGWGHFIVIKGYKVVDGVTFYEAYDPYSFGNYYSGIGGLLGQDRYYKAVELEKATQFWWDYAIIIGNPGGAGGGRLKAVDVNSIPIASGQ